MWSLKNHITHYAFRLLRVVENIENMWTGGEASGNDANTQFFQTFTFLFLLKRYAKLPSKWT